MTQDILNPGFDLTLRPMRYPRFFEMYRDAIKNTWTVEEVDFSTDLNDLDHKMTPAERHLIRRLVAFFATGDSIVANNLVLNLYKHINSPEARMYLSRQLFEEAVHVQFYLTLLDTYIPDHAERAAAFAAVENIPSIATKAEFAMRWMGSIDELDELDTEEKKRQFLLNLICFAACVEGLFFFGAFAYVYFLRSRNLLHGLSAGTSWVFRDEACVPIDTTEVLTENGWMLMRDALAPENDWIKIAQYDTETQEVTFAHPNGRVQKHVSEDLVRVSKDKSLSATMTKDHDFLFRRTSTGKCMKVKAEKAPTSSISELVCAGKGVGEHVSLTTPERIAIAWQADGLIRLQGNGSRIGHFGARFSLKEQRKITRLSQLLDDSGWEYSGNSSEDGYSVFYVKVPVDFIHLFSNKGFEWVDLEGVSDAWGKEFIEELSAWDGYKAEDCSCIQYTNTNKGAVDTVSAIAALSGYTCNVYRREDNRSDAYSDVYNAFIKKRDFVQLAKATRELVPFEGEVGCFSMPKGTLVFRQDGKPFISGNCHMNFAFECIDVVRSESPHLFTPELESQVVEMLAEAITCEVQFARDLLSGGVVGLTPEDMRQYLEFCADQRLARLGYKRRYNVKNPFAFMDLQDVQELTNFFERRVSAYQVGVTGDVDFGEEF